MWNNLKTTEDTSLYFSLHGVLNMVENLISVEKGLKIFKWKMEHSRKAWLVHLKPKTSIKKLLYHNELNISRTVKGKKERRDEINLTEVSFAEDTF